MAGGNSETGKALAAATAEREQAERELQAAQAAFDTVEIETGAVRAAEERVSVARVRVRRATQTEADAHQAHAAAERERKREQLRAAEQASSVETFKRSLAAPIRRLVELRAELVGAVRDVRSVADQQAATVALARGLAAEIDEPTTAREFGMSAAHALCIEAQHHGDEPGLSFGEWLSAVPALQARAHAIGHALRPGGVQSHLSPERTIAVLLDTLDPAVPANMREAELVPWRAAAEAERIAEEQRRDELVKARDWASQVHGERANRARDESVARADREAHAHSIAELAEIRRREDLEIAEWRASRGIVEQRAAS